TTTDVVLGEKTPGPKTTPVAPGTGSGFSSTSSSMNILLAVFGAIAISGGLAALALGNKRRN
ncbi:MAG: LPXTG cell wall anchor domain-containing protein, partial [Tepidiformaceae bacterium]